MPFQVVGQHAREGVGPYPVRQDVVDGVDFQIHGFQHPESHLHMAAFLVGLDRLLGADLFGRFYPQTSHLWLRQIQWTIVHKNEKASYGKRITQSRLTPVLLDMVQGRDAKDCAMLLKISPATVNHYARAWETEHGRYLPRRDVIHDIGSTLTHKRQIVRMIVQEGRKVEDVCAPPTTAPKPPIATSRPSNRSFSANAKASPSRKPALPCRSARGSSANT
jgi:hypothetical protein